VVVVVVAEVRIVQVSDEHEWAAARRDGHVLRFLVQQTA